MSTEDFKTDEVVDSAETTTEDYQDDSSDSYEDDSDSESEGASPAEESEQRQPETYEAKQARLKRQAEREAKKQGKTLAEYLGLESKKDSKESTTKEVDSDEKYNRLYLKTEGYKSRAEQDIILDYAEWKGVDVDEALKSPLVKGEIKEYRDKAATPKPSVRTSKGANTSVDALVAKYKAKKYLNPDEMRQVRKKLRG